MNFIYLSSLQFGGKKTRALEINYQAIQHRLQHEMDQKTLNSLKQMSTMIYEVVYDAVQQYVTYIASWVS